MRAMERRIEPNVIRQPRGSRNGEDQEPLIFEIGIRFHRDDVVVCQGITGQNTP